MKHILILAALVFSSLASGAAVSAAPAGKVYQIVIDRATFGTPPTAVKVGDTIEWINKDDFDHTSTAKNGAWDVKIASGKKARVVLKKAGTVDYYCRFHPNMVGTIIIKP